MTCEKNDGWFLCVCWPVRCSHKGIGRWGNGSRTKVSQFDLTQLSQQDVTSFHVSDGGEEGQSQLQGGTESPPV